MRTYLQDASDAGAKLLPNVWVDRILTDNGAAVGVEATYTDPQTQQISRVVINAPAVVAAAGSLETPGLLLRSGIGGPAVGAELRLHPASLVSGVYDEPQDPWYGPAMAGIMNEFAETDEGFGYIIECVQHLPGLFTTVVPWLDGAGHKELTRKYRYRADWVFIVKDRGAGSVTIDENGQSTFWYPFSDELDRRHFREAAVTSYPHARSRGCATDLPGRPTVRALAARRRPGGVHRKVDRDPDRSWRNPGVQCAPDVQREVR